MTLRQHILARNILRWTLPKITYGVTKDGVVSLTDRRFTRKTTAGEESTLSFRFYEFLKEHDALEIYILNVLNNPVLNYGSADRVGKYEFLNNVFSWSISVPPPYPYSWSNLSADWSRVVQAEGLGR